MIRSKSDSSTNKTENTDSTNKRKTKLDRDYDKKMYMCPDTFEPHTAVASIENLENARADGVVAAIKSSVSKCGIDLDNMTESKLNVVCINLRQCCCKPRS